MPGSRVEKTRVAQLVLGSSTAFLVLYPVVVLFIKDRYRGLFAAFASDAFYYLTIAKRSIGLPFYSFDGSTPTNGFHPLWQYYLTATFSIAAPTTGASVHQLLIAWSTGLFLVMLGNVFFALTLLRLTRSLPLSLLGAVPGFYYLLTATVEPNVGSPWAFANGMESSLSIFFFGLALYLLLGRNPCRRLSSLELLLGSLLLTVLVLSRLDDIFLALPYLLLVAGISPPGRRRRNLAIAATPFSALLALYLLYNLHSAHLLLPVSGALKSNFALLANLRACLDCLTPLAPITLNGWGWQQASFRVLQIVLPALASGVWLTRWYRNRRPIGLGASLESDWRGSIVALLGIYVLAKATYTFVFVDFGAQGYWYFPCSIMLFNLMATCWLQEALPSDRHENAAGSDGQEKGKAGSGRTLALFALACIAGGVFLLFRILGNTDPAIPPARLATTAGLLTVGALLFACRRMLSAVLRPMSVGAVLLSLLFANALVSAKEVSQFNHHAFEVWSHAAAIEQELRARNAGQLLEMDDGIFGYSLETPTMSGFGFCLDRQGKLALRQGKLLDLAYGRGFRTLASAYYFETSQKAESSHELLRQEISRWEMLKGESLSRWEFEFLYRDSASGAAFIRFYPAGQPVH